MSLTGKIADWLLKQKDTSASAMLRRVLQKSLLRYGHMIHFNIDSRNKSIQLEVMLKGEKDPITLNVEEYEIKSEEGGTFLVIKRATASREWITVVLHDFLQGKAFRIPDAYAGVSKLVL